MLIINPFINLIDLICRVMNIVLLISLFIIIGIFIFKYRKENKQDIYILKTIGFTKKNIFILYLIKDVLNIISTLLISIILLTILYFIILYIVKYKYVILSIFKITYPTISILKISAFSILYILIINTILIIITKEFKTNV